MSVEHGDSSVRGALVADSRSSSNRSMQSSLSRANSNVSNSSSGGSLGAVSKNNSNSNLQSYREQEDDIVNGSVDPNGARAGDPRKLEPIYRTNSGNLPALNPDGGGLNSARAGRKIHSVPSKPKPQLVSSIHLANMVVYKGSYFRFFLSFVFISIC